MGELKQGAPFRRVNVNFSLEAYQSLEDLARSQGKTMSDVLRDAIALERFFAETRREGGRFLVERDGRVRELVKV